MGAGTTESNKSKNQYAIPGAVALTILAIEYGLDRYLLGSLLEEYSRNKAQVIADWVREGMPSNSLDETVSAVDGFLREAGARAIEGLVYAGVFLLVAVKSDDIVLWNRWSLSKILEFPALLYMHRSNIVGGCLEIYFSGTASVACALVLLGVPCWCARKRISCAEGLLYLPFMLAIVGTLSVYLLCSSPLPLGLAVVPLCEFGEIQPGIKRAVIERCAEFGVGSDSIVIQPGDGMNAFSLRGIRFRMVGFSSKLVDAMNEGQVMATLMHELGHIRRFDNQYDYWRLIFFLGMMLACSFPVYRKFRKHMNPLIGLFVLHYVWLVADTALDMAFNATKSHQMEFLADQHACSGLHVREIEQVLKILALHKNGQFFDFNRGFGMTQSHPSTLKRVIAVRGFAAANRPLSEGA